MLLLKLWIACIGLFLTGSPVLAQSNEPPNVLFIAVDDLNDWVGALKGQVS
ncbi:MAG: hypothetical protein R6V72_16470 [Cyclobacterium sp.]|uniref:hypothetical protein n=1 Tax=unclassified Cyclobacterium TaxID=2615055 RepID=UPI0013D5A875|nr:hypothetical protein [Cyclobacterium sp. SYSU L10401]